MEAGIIGVIIVLIAIVLIAMAVSAYSKEKENTEVSNIRKENNMENNSTGENKELVSKDIEIFYLKSINENISTIKFWIVFWSILSIVGAFIYIVALTIN